MQHLEETKDVSNWNYRTLKKMKETKKWQNPNYKFIEINIPWQRQGD